MALVPAGGCLQDVSWQEPLWRDACGVGWVDEVDPQENAGVVCVVLASNGRVLELVPIVSGYLDWGKGRGDGIHQVFCSRKKVIYRSLPLQCREITP